MVNWHMQGSLPVDSLDSIILQAYMKVFFKVAWISKFCITGPVATDIIDINVVRNSFPTPNLPTLQSKNQ